MMLSATQPRVLTATEKAALASRLRLACMRIARRVRFESASSVAPHQFSVLVRLSEGPSTPKELATIERVSAPSMTRTVSGLVEQGLVSRADDPSDGRQVILSLTAEGRALVRATKRAREGWMALRLKGLSDDEIDTLARAADILERIAAR